MWLSGDQIALRYRTAGRLSMVLPVTVVEDSADCVALYLAAGTAIKTLVSLDGESIPRETPYEERHAMPRRMGDAVWHTNSRLMLARPGAAHAVSVFWRDADWSFVCWYVDLQAPLKRTASGFESEDFVLDIVISPDGTWYWKDEDEFAAAQRVGRFSTEQAAAIRAEGERVVEAIETRGWPFDAGWEGWRPDPSWEIPILPAGWDSDEASEPQSKDA